MSNNELFLAIFIMSIANIITRVFPFLFFRKNELPKSLIFVEKNFPSIIMTILIFYTLSKIDFNIAPYGGYEFLAIIIAIVLHLKFDNYLISIFVSTLSYMIMVQMF